MPDDLAYARALVRARAPDFDPDDTGTPPPPGTRTGSWHDRPLGPVYDPSFSRPDPEPLAALRSVYGSLYLTSDDVAMMIGRTPASVRKSLWRLRRMGRVGLVGRLPDRLRGERRGPAPLLYSALTKGGA